MSLRRDSTALLLLLAGCAGPGRGSAEAIVPVSPGASVQRPGSADAIGAWPVPHEGMRWRETVTMHAESTLANDPLYEIDLRITSQVRVLAVSREGLPLRLEHTIEDATGFPLAAALVGPGDVLEVRPGAAMSDAFVLRGAPPENDALGGMAMLAPPYPVINPNQLAAPSRLVREGRVDVTERLDGRLIMGPTDMPPEVGSGVLSFHAYDAQFDEVELTAETHHVDGLTMTLTQRWRLRRDGRGPVPEEWMRRTMTQVLPGGERLLTTHERHTRRSDAISAQDLADADVPGRLLSEAPRR